MFSSDKHQQTVSFASKTLDKICTSINLDSSGDKVRTASIRLALMIDHNARSMSLSHTMVETDLYLFYMLVSKKHRKKKSTYDAEPILLACASRIPYFFLFQSASLVAISAEIQLCTIM